MFSSSQGKPRIIRKHVPQPEPLNAGTPAGDAKKLEDLSGKLKYFLRKTASAFQTLGEKKADELSRFDAYEKILEVSDELPEWIREFPAHVETLTVVDSAAKIRWSRDLAEISKDAAHLPKGIAKNRDMMADWLTKITKPLRRTAQDMDKVIGALRRQELATPGRGRTPAVLPEGQPRGPWTKDRGVEAPKPSSGPATFKEKIAEIVRKSFPEMAKEMGVEIKPEKPESASKWVDQQMADFVNTIRDPDKELLQLGDEIGFVEASIVAQADIGQEGHIALERAGFHVTTPMYWLNIANAISVGIRKDAHPTLKKVQDFVTRLKKADPQSEIAKRNLVPYPTAHSRRQHIYWLLLPAKAGGDLTIHEWSFTKD